MGFFRSKATPKVVDPAIALEEEEEEKRVKKQKAIEGLNPTGTLGAGTPETTRRRVLGV